MAGNYASNLRQITVDGRIISDLMSAQVPEITDSEVTRIMAGGKKGVGFNTFQDANAFDYEFSVSTPSGDDRFLWNLCQAAGTVAFTYAYVDASELPDEAFVGIAGVGKIYRRSRTLGDEAEEQTYVFKANGYTASFKNAQAIVVG